jgi:hypothetical protein
MSDLEAIYADYLVQIKRAEKIAEIEMNRDTVVHELAAKWDASAQEKGNDENWYQDAVSFLSEKDAESLLLMSEATTWDEFMAAMDGEVLKPDFGNPSSELVFYPLEPCRVLDTRVAPRWGFNPIPSNGAINVDVSGTEFGQGVPNVANCSVSTDAKAVVVNLAAVPVSGEGFITVWPFASARPLAGQLNYSSFISQAAISNSFIVQVCRGCSDEISIYSFPGSTHVVVDVLGYFARPSATPLDITVVSTPLTTLTPGQLQTLTTPFCPSDYVATGGGWEETINGSGPMVDDFGPVGDNRWKCTFINESSSNMSVQCRAVCARIPGR